MGSILGRIGTAFRLLIGLEPTWWSVRREWAEMRGEAQQLFDNLNALQARLAKRHKELTELLTQSVEPPGGTEELPDDLAARKAALRRRVAEARGIAPLRGPSHVGSAVPSPDGMGRWVPADAPDELPDEDEDE